MYMRLVSVGVSVVGCSKGMAHWEGKRQQEGAQITFLKGGGGKILSYATAGKVRAMGDVKDREEMDQMGWDKEQLALTPHSHVHSVHSITINVSSPQDETANFPLLCLAY